MSKSDDLDFEISFYGGLVKRSPNRVDALIPLAEAYTKKGLYEKGLVLDKRLARLCKDDPTVHYNLACSLALTGKRAEAIAALRHALKLGYLDFNYLREDPDLKSLHSDPEFEKLVDYFLKERSSP